MTLRLLADDLWLAERQLSFFGIEMGTRMTVARIDGDVRVAPDRWSAMPFPGSPAMDEQAGARCTNRVRRRLT